MIVDKPEMPKDKHSPASAHTDSGKPSEPASAYRNAGVDIDAGNDFVECIKPLCASTLRPEVIGGIGGFGGLFRLNTARYQSPVLVSATDGVGTKLKIAGRLGMHRGIGIDLVAMCVNDILTHGAEPLFFLDYLACGRLSPLPATEVVSGIAKGCRIAGCSLLGGETAEMPGMYTGGEYDLAGFAVGVAEESALCGVSRVGVGDLVIALASSGVHANGFSLVRRILEESGTRLDQHLGDATLGETLLTPTRIYVPALRPALLRGDIHALAHITGGGLTGNLPRILGDRRSITVDLRSWAFPPVFEWLQETGRIGWQEMLQVFNCGVGMVAVVAPDRAAGLIQATESAGIHSWQLGEVVPRGKHPAVIYD